MFKIGIEEILQKLKDSPMPKNAKREFIWFLVKNHFRLATKAIFFFVIFFIGLLFAVSFYINNGIIDNGYFYNQHHSKNVLIFLTSFSLLFMGLISIVCFYFYFKFLPKIIEYEKKYFKKKG